MGVYSIDRHNMTDVIPANESYDHVTGPARILLESEQNDIAVFTAIICNDMSNITKMNEGALLESELENLNEAAGASFFETIGKAIDAVISKIKGMIKSFIEKVSVMLSVNSTKFVKKYADVLEKKDLTKFTYKVRKSTTGDRSIVVDTKALMEQYSKDVFDEIWGRDAETVKSKLADYENSDSLRCELLNTTYSGLNVSSPKDYHEAIMNAMFKPEEEYTGLSANDVRSIVAMLSVETPFLKVIETSKNQDIADLSAMSKEFHKRARDKKEDKDIQVVANAQYKITQIGNTALVAAYSEWMSAIKFDIQQYFAVLKKAVIYTPAAKNESSELEDYAYSVAMDEVAMAIDL